MQFSSFPNRRAAAGREDDRWLPDDLAPMIDRLRCEAVELADTYPPAHESLPVVRPDPALRRSRRGWFIAAALLLSLGVGIRALMESGERRPIEQHGTALAPSGETVCEDRSVAELPESSGGSIAEMSGGPPWTRAAFVREFSGPELEAWLDLRSDQGLDREHLSM